MVDIKDDDPFASSISYPSEITSSQEFITSLPLSERAANHASWRRIIVGIKSETELAAKVVILEDYRNAGLIVPPYSAIVEKWSEGLADSYVLQVGHVEGSLFEKLDSHVEQVNVGYTELGVKILNYLDGCWTSGRAFLTDITRIDQFVYGQTASMTKDMPVLVDLELLSCNAADLEGVELLEIELFMTDFLLPLEQASEVYQQELRIRLKQLVLKYDTTLKP